jgi:uncharacterized protein YdhG (YjbR/CyaY superfamily)
MAITIFKTVKDYIASKPRDVQALLKQLQDAIRKAVPDAEEVISYQMPGYKLKGGYLLFFAVWKEHFSLYPASDVLVENFKDELSRYKRSKGTIRFPLSEPVPVSRHDLEHQRDIGGRSESRRSRDILSRTQGAQRDNDVRPSCTLTTTRSNSRTISQPHGHAPLAAGERIVFEKYTGSVR